MRDMTPEELKKFLTENAFTATIATVRDNGRPHAAPIWFILEGDDIYFTTWHTSVKVKNIQRDPYVSLCIDDEQLPYAYVVIEGTVTIVDVTSDERINWATRIARRYVGDDKAESFGKRNGVEGEWIVRLKPTKIIAKTGIAD
jgi:PPOX class probable F420-dependent enzyme